MRVLFLYPNCNNLNWLPLGIADIAGVLKEMGVATKVFDTTFYHVIGSYFVNSVREGQKQGQYIKGSFDSIMKIEDITFEDLLERYDQVLCEFQPDLIALSAMSQFYELGAKLLRSSHGSKVPVIVGGVHPTVNPEEVIADDYVNMICIGEGEGAVAELCKRMINGKDYNDVKSLWVKENGRVFKNELRPLLDLDQNPISDYTIFDDRYFYQPFLNGVYRIAPYEMQRGCPYSCSYCTNTYFKDLNKGLGSYWRRKSFTKAISEMSCFRDDYNLELIRFVDDTFMAMSVDKFREFADLYIEKVNVPFFINTRPETVTKDKVQILKEMKCVSVSIGLESGNEEIRNQVLNRKMSDESLINAFRYLKDVNIRTSSFDMIGLPYETRENIMETVELNRKCDPDTISVNIFYPYKRTVLADLCVKENFCTGDEIAEHYQVESGLKMPQISPKEIRALKSTFSLYVKLPKLIYPVIRMCESDYLISRLIYPFLIYLVGKIQKYRKSTRILNRFLKNTYGH